MPDRLHKVLAHCGVGSRRDCETIIEQGRVEVNGQVVSKVGTKVTPDKDEIRVDGERVKIEERVYYILHKPRGYLCTTSDDRGRRTVLDLIRDNRRIYPVGRLDEQSEGLVLLSNDGELANIICHPRYQVDKTYRLTLKGHVQRDQLERIERGVWLAEGKTGPAQVRRVVRKGDRTFVSITLWEGRNRELRRIFAKVGLTVGHLVRTGIGPLRLADLPPGAYRQLKDSDLDFVRARLAPGWKPVPVKTEKRPSRPSGSRRNDSRGPRGPRRRGDDRGPQRRHPSRR